MGTGFTLIFFLIPILIFIGLIVLIARLFTTRGSVRPGSFVDTTIVDDGYGYSPIVVVDEVVVPGSAIVDNGPVFEAPPVQMFDNAPAGDYQGGAGADFGGGAGADFGSGAGADFGGGGFDSGGGGFDSGGGGGGDS